MLWRRAAGADGFADFFADAHYAPVGGQFRTAGLTTATRRGIAAAAQWESNRPTRSAYRAVPAFARRPKPGASTRWARLRPFGIQYLSRSAVSRTVTARTRRQAPAAECRVDGAGQFVFGNNGQGNGYNPLAGQSFPNYQYDDDGVFESGYITLPGTGWRTPSSGSATTRVPTGGMQQSLDAPPGPRQERRHGCVAQLQVPARRRIGTSTSTPNM